MDNRPVEMTAERWLAPVLERGLVSQSALAVFVVGSVALGWHNSRSDYDIYIVTSKKYHSLTSRPVPVPLAEASLATETFYTRERRWDVTYWLDSQVEEVLSKVSRDSISPGTPTEKTLSIHEELLLSRLGSCLALHGGDWIERNSARAAASAFRELVVVRSLGAAEDAVEDALGQLEAGNFESATISARKAFGHAVDALLESLGQYGSHEQKWRPKRFRAADPDVITFDEYWAVETMQGYQAADPAPWIKSVLTLCQDLAMRVKIS